MRQCLILKLSTGMVGTEVTTKLKRIIVEIKLFIAKMTWLRGSLIKEYSIK